MSTRPLARTRIATVLLTAVLAACGSTDDPVEPDVTGDSDDAADAGPTAPDETAPDEAAPGSGSGSDGTADLGQYDADPLQVLLAVVVLTTGDVDAAVAEGLVTPAELDLAEAAVAAREVSVWLARADLLLHEDDDAAAPAEAGPSR